MRLEKQIERQFGLTSPVCRPLNTLVHDVVEVTAQEGRFALELYNAAFRTAKAVQWELDLDTYILLGRAAAHIYTAADSFEPACQRDNYSATVLIDEQLWRMKAHLVAAKQWERMVALGKRLERHIGNPALDRGLCHMDLTLDNVHQKRRGFECIRL